MSSSTDPSHEAAIRPLLARFRDQQGALLPLLHAVQDALGFVPPEAVPLIAKVLNLSRAEVHGVITYYHHFREAPPGKHVIRVCCAEACQANGSEALAEHAARCMEHGDVTMEPVYCLGLCSIGPAVQVDETVLHARMTPEKFNALLETLGKRS